MRNIIILSACLIIISQNIQAKPITNELIYRELKIFQARTEERFKAIDNRFEAMDKRFEAIDKRFDQVDNRFNDMFSYLGILAGIFTSLVIAVLGFAFWDRKTTIAKAKEETLKEIPTNFSNLIEQYEKQGPSARLLFALKELSNEDSKLARVLNKYNLL